MQIKNNQAIFSEKFISELERKCGINFKIKKMQNPFKITLENLINTQELNKAF